MPQPTIGQSPTTIESTSSPTVRIPEMKSTRSGRSDHSLKELCRIAPMWSIGVSVFMKDGKERVWKKVLTHPCIVAIYIGVAIMISGITLPVFVEKTITAISNCNTPFSMMLIGMMLAEVKPKGLIDKTMVFYATVRLVIIPTLIFLATAWMPVDPMLRGITIIMAGMPAPITTALLSAKYDGDERYATGMVFLTTILSLITLPVWCIFI